MVFNFYKRVACLLGFFIIAVQFPVIAQQKNQNFCNPLNLNYRFSYDNSSSYREAADPVIHLYKNKYFLYASKSGGYWYADNMLHWTFRPSVTLPVEDYAPTVETIGDTVFFLASGGAGKIYYNLNPLEDNWKVYNAKFQVSMTDPALFKDDDGRVFLYYGCSNRDPIRGVELDPKRLLDTLGSAKVLIGHKSKEHGWEEAGEKNDGGKEGWNEGSWMTKYNGKYYLQYSSPGTEFKVYGDGVYVAEKPLGPFTYMPNSPFSYKPGGFINGAGHGATFQDKYGNYWHVATMTISVRHMFERRVGLFPAFFDREGQLHCNTAFGDYPSLMPNRKMNFEKESTFPGWMLLSYHKPVSASSTLPGHQPELAGDEEVRTWWAASTGNKGEWLQMDLEKPSTIHAIQVNFADEGARLKANDHVKPYQYTISVSEDGKKWHSIVDQSKNTADVTHDYQVLDKAVKARYVKMINYQVPDGNFSISGLRIFGKGTGKLPEAVKTCKVQRDAQDTRHARLDWKAIKGATGYVVYFGNTKNKLYQSAMVYGNPSLELRGLNKGVPYFFRVDAFNENGVTRGTQQ
ncbi:discoidin domain-containing protein [Pedobacter steynii]|nr:discoidin domain-containing protein [Pedobacter steynii]NQX40883.1 discoidin domain-containing protein [Pedobacter steynii]